MPPPLPAGFRFGVATGGFQVEGGYNGAGEPANNWRDWEAGGRVERSGPALDFWNRYEEHLDRAVDAGCDAFRFSVEWARCEPVEGRLDDDALARYAQVLDACHARGLLPVVALHHFTHPHWLGPDLWLGLEAPARFAAWAGAAVDALGDRCRHWITINEPNALAVQSWMTGGFPPGRRLATGDMVRALDHLLAAHVLAYRAVHRRQPEAMVSVTNAASSIYELDRLLLDVLVARARGVPRHGLGAWLGDRRRSWYAGVAPPSAGERLLRGAARRAVPLEQALPRAVSAVWDGPRPASGAGGPRPASGTGGPPGRLLDAVLVNYYDPVAGNRLPSPGRRAPGSGWFPSRRLWDEPVHPEGLTAYCRANHEPGLELCVAENGLCNRVVDGRARARSDGWDRVRFLRANLAAVARAVEGGVPVTAYFHWTLADNYEWGSYEPRFGLYGVDRKGDRTTEPGSWRLDSMGGDAAGAYRRLADGSRAGDPGALR